MGQGLKWCLNGCGSYWMCIHTGSAARELPAQPLWSHSHNFPWFFNKQFCSQNTPRKSQWQFSKPGEEIITALDRFCTKIGSKSRIQLNSLWLSKRVVHPLQFSKWALFQAPSEVSSILRNELLLEVSVSLQCLWKETDMRQIKYQHS